MELDKIAERLATILLDRSSAFVDGHAEDVALLGKDAVEDVLDAEITAVIDIPKLPPDPSMQVIADHADLTNQVATRFALTSQAEKEDNERAKKLKSDAKKAAAEIAGMFTGVAVSVLKSVIVKNRPEGD